MYDVLEVDIKTKLVTVVARGKDLDNAHAFIRHAVMRLGVKDSFFVAAAEDSYVDGEKWVGHRTKH